MIYVTQAKLLFIRKLSEGRVSPACHGVGQGNKRKPSYGDLPSDWPGQELSFHTQFPDENNQHLELQSEQEKTEYFKLVCSYPQQN